MAERGEYTCASCRRRLPADEFGRDYLSGKASRVCKECRNRLVLKPKADEPPVEAPTGKGNPPCPKCKGATNKLHAYGGRTLYECTKFACGNQFSTGEPPPERPIPIVAEALPPPQRMSSPSEEIPSTHSHRTSDVEAGSPEKTEEREEKPMSNDGDLPDLEKAGPCRKGCGQELGATSWGRKRHERRCEGAAPEPEEKPERKPKAERSAKPNAARPAVHRIGSAIPAAIEELKAKREAIIAGIPELQQINDLIGKLEAMHG